jgi:hypothetical protein
MTKLLLLVKASVIDAFVIFLFGPVHLIYLALRYGADFGRGVIFVYPMFFTLILVFLINAGYNLFKLSYGGLNTVDKTRWFGIWLIFHTLLYLYLELTMLNISTVFYVECAVSAVIYMGFMIFLHYRMFTRLPVARY